MSNTELIPVEVDEDLGPRVLKMRLQGQTSAQIARELMIPVHQVHQALDHVLPTVDANYRRRAIAESLVTIDTVIAEHMKHIRDPESASIIIRGCCERRSLLGISGSTDPVQLSMQSRSEPSTAAYQRGIAFIENLRRLAAEEPSGSSGSDDAGIDIDFSKPLT
jgi:hypothetical protein